MRLKELTDIMYAGVRVLIYDSNDGFYCYPVYAGQTCSIPGLYMNRTVHAIDSEAPRIAIILESEGDKEE